MTSGDSSLKRLLGRVHKVARLRPRFASYEPMAVTRAEFDKQYADGEWKRLDDISELAHYSMIAGYSSFFHQSPAILDVGCGHGVLQGKLAGKYAHYTGIDSSSEAIGQADSRSDERTRFLVADATAYVPDRSFDQIVFNEILYYMAKPTDLIAHYVPHLLADGRLIVSMYELDRSRMIWPMLEERYLCEDAVTVRHDSSGLQWTIKTFRVRAS